MENTNFDVIVIGAGFAGLAAAIEARNAGASVLIVEKMKAPGGNSIISDGGIAIPGSDLQKKANVKDSPELMYKDMMAAGLHLNHPTLVETVCKNALDAYVWTKEYLQVQYLDRVDLFGGHSVARSHAVAGVSGAGLIKPMLNKAAELDIEIRKGIAFKHFIRRDGKIAGIKVVDYFSENNTEVTALYAGKAVVFACGGFGADVAFRSVQDPRLTKDIDTTNKHSAKAEALTEALKLGAMPIQLSHIQLGPWASPDEKGFGNGPLFADYIGFIYGMIVHHKTGKRIVHEQADRKTVSDAILAAGKPCLCICDSKAVENSGWDLSKAIKKEVVRIFSTLKELADYHGLPLHALNKSIKEAEQLENRTAPASLRQKPFYCMRVWPKVHYTMGGIQIDSQARVIDLDNRPIEGLYAAGEATGGVHGASRLGSCAITDCLVFGRIAGQNAAANTQISETE